MAKETTGDGKIYLANMSKGELRKEFTGSVINFLSYDLDHRRLLGQIRLAPGAACGGIVRNTEAGAFYNNTPYEWLLFIDSDMEFAPEDIYNLIDGADPIKRPIISGVYVMPRSSGMCNSAFVWKMDKKFGVKNMFPKKMKLDGKIKPVDGCGAGFLLIHRSVLLKMSQKFGIHPWFADGVIEGAVYGEDFTFCIRAAQVGYPIYVHTGVLLGHYKTVRLHPHMIIDGKAVMVEKKLKQKKEETDGI